MQLDAHHRQARQAGGVHGDAELRANAVSNMLALCRRCHDETEHEETWALTEGLGWRIPKWVAHPELVPAFIYTVQGRAWWILTSEGGYQWVDREQSFRISWSD